MKRIKEFLCYSNVNSFILDVILDVFSRGRDFIQWDLLGEIAFSVIL